MKKTSQATPSPSINRAVIAGSNAFSGLSLGQSPLPAPNTALSNTSFGSQLNANFAGQRPVAPLGPNSETPTTTPIVQPLTNQPPMSPLDFAELDAPSPQQHQTSPIPVTPVLPEEDEDLVVLERIYAYLSENFLWARAMPVHIPFFSFEKDRSVIDFPNGYNRQQVPLLIPLNWYDLSIYIYYYYLYIIYCLQCLLGFRIMNILLISEEECYKTLHFPL